MLDKKRPLPGAASGSCDGEPAPDRVAEDIFGAGPKDEADDMPKGERMEALPPDEGSLGEVVALAGFDKDWPRPPGCANLPIVKCSGLEVDIID